MLLPSRSERSDRFALNAKLGRKQRLNAYVRRRRVAARLKERKRFSAFSDYSKRLEILGFRIVSKTSTHESHEGWKV